MRDLDAAPQRSFAAREKKKNSGGGTGRRHSRFGDEKGAEHDTLPRVGHDKRAEAVGGSKTLAARDVIEGAGEVLVRRENGEGVCTGDRFFKPVGELQLQG